MTHVRHEHSAAHRTAGPTGTSVGTGECTQPHIILSQRDTTFLLSTHALTDPARVVHVPPCHLVLLRELRVRPELTAFISLDDLDVVVIDDCAWHDDALRKAPIEALHRRDVEVDVHVYEQGGLHRALALERRRDG